MKLGIKPINAIRRAYSLYDKALKGYSNLSTDFGSSWLEAVANIAFGGYFPFHSPKTHTQLMAARHDCTGTICFDEAELRGISSQSLYELVSIIEQNVFVFDAQTAYQVTY